MDKTFLSYLFVHDIPTMPRDRDVLSRFNARLSKIGMEGKLLSRDGAAGPMLFDVGGLTLPVLFVHRAYPQPDLEEPLQLERQWASARGDLNGHRGHIVVGTGKEPAGHTDAISIAIILSMLTAALVETLGAIGVLWGTGQKLTTAREFVKAVDGIPNKQIPTLSWLQLQFLSGPHEGGAQTTAIATIGLEIFVGREIEWLPSQLTPVEAAQRVLGVATYLLAEGPKLQDGDTASIFPRETLRARFSDVGHRPHTRVVTLSVDACDRPADRA